MALIKCPECGRQISNKAHACIYCGYPLSTINTLQPEKPILSEDERIKQNITVFLKIRLCAKSIGKIKIFSQLILILKK